MIIQPIILDPNEGTAEITQLLERINNGDRASEAQFLRMVHAELRQLAAKCMRRERRDHLATVCSGE